MRHPLSHIFRLFHSLPLFACILVGSGLCAYAQPDPLIGLVIPPPGGEGYSGALQSGGNFADGAASLYYNPATLAELGRATETRLQTAYSFQSLLPEVDDSDLNQNFWAVSAELPSLDGFDIGVGFFRNEINEGRSPPTFFNDSETETYVPHETVYALGLGVRLGVPISVGGTVKFDDSHLGPAVDTLGLFHNQKSQSWAFDLGILASPVLCAPAKWNLPFGELSPSVGLVFQNLGPRAFFGLGDTSVPLPSQFNLSFGSDLQLFDFADLKIGEERDYSTWETYYVEPVVTYGYSLGILCYRFSQSLLTDPHGERREIFYANAFELNVLQLRRFLKRVRTQDFRTPSKNLIENIPARTNLRFTFGVRKIHADDDGIREGQTAYYFNFSL
jgi:hypothetical protein